MREVFRTLCFQDGQQLEDAEETLVELQSELTMVKPLVLRVCSDNTTSEAYTQVSETHVRSMAERSPKATHVHSLADP